MSQRTGYSAVQIALHWAVAVLILFNYIYSDGMGGALDVRLGKEAAEHLDITPSIHVWVGVAVLVLCLLRIVLRLGLGAPEPGGTGMMQTIAVWGHKLLYVLMILAPLAGAFTWFGGVESIGDVHAVLANALMIVAGGHAAAAIYHQFILRDRLMQRMRRPGSM